MTVADAKAIVHWIVGTAGHIDHGKTSLIKALTGQDTDRLKEEKERGISIDLGFAHLDLPDGLRAGVVDVPGHERFIRNMLAGAHGIDLVLFTVAADDGVMPQTEEHLDILHVLGVRRAIFVITKSDLASQSRIDEVVEEIHALTVATSLEGSPIVPFSFVTGDGLDRLRDQIASDLRTGSKPRPEGYFRMPVDRAFVSTGHGLIVTGTAVAGEVRLGDRVRCLPGDEILRVRSVEVHNEAVEVATWGQRIAMNLTGSTRASITRGDVVCHEKITLTTTRFDARLEIRPTAPAGLRNYQRIRVHLGTAERLGKVILLRSRERRAADALAPGGAAYCQIVLTEPLVALQGDRFIVRDETARRTLGGGVVIHPAAAKHKRSDPKLSQKLEHLEQGDEAALIDECGEFAISLPALAQLMNRREEDARARLATLGAVHVLSDDGQTQYALERTCVQAKAALLEAIGAWHAAQPASPGIDMEEARAGIPVRVPPKIFRLLVQELEQERTVAREGSLLRLPDHRVQVSGIDQGLVERIRALLERASMSPPDAKQLAQDLSVERQKLAELLRAMEKQRSIVRVAPDLYFHRERLDQVRIDLCRELAAKGTMTAAEFRDRFQTSRKYAIPLLEYFDREGVTVRTGEVRKLKRPYTETA